MRCKGAGLVRLQGQKALTLQGCESHLGEGLFEEVSRALELGAGIALDELLQVGEPDVAYMRVLE